MFIGLITAGLSISSFAERNTEWVTSSSKRLCEKNGGTMNVKGYCEGSWDVAKDVCIALGGVLPSKKQLFQAQTYCANQTEKSYMSCYAEKGFKTTNYWSNAKATHGRIETLFFLDKPTLATQQTNETLSSAIQCVKNQWITPTTSICTSNNGKLKKGTCVASWENAKSICSASGGSLASIENFEAVIIECGGSIDDLGLNRNSNYQSCYKKKGFYGRFYWSSNYGHLSGNEVADYVRFRDGSRKSGDRSRPVSVRCINTEQ